MAREAAVPDEDRIALDLAIHEDHKGEPAGLLLIAHTHGITIEGLRERLQDPGFKTRMAVQRASTNYNAVAHRARCSALAGRVLQELMVIFRDEKVPPATRVKIGELVMRDAGLQPREAAPETGTNVVIRIDLSSAGVEEDRVITVGSDDAGE